MLSWVNSQRLKNYPRLFLFAIWVILSINLILHRGWFGYFGGLIGIDHVAFYAGGLLYRQSPEKLYDLATQIKTIQQLFLPTQFSDTEFVNSFQYPPFVAMIFSLETYLPVTSAFAVGTLFSILCGLLAAWLAQKYLLVDHLKSALSPIQMGIVLFSFLPFVLGLFWGQNHALTLLLTTGIVVSIITKRWALAGLLAGFLCYKPYFVVGFLLFLFVERRWKSIVTFVTTFISWIGIDILISGGPGIYNQFIQASRSMGQIQNASKINFQANLYSLIPWPANIPPVIFILGWVAITSLILLMIFCFLHSKAKISQSLLISLAVLSPYLISHHIVIYDLAPVLVGLLLLARHKPKQELLYLSIFVYCAPIFLIALMYFGKFAWLSILPLSITGYTIYEISASLK